MFAIKQSNSPLSDVLSNYGYIPSDITDVILTLHFDHAGGAIRLNSINELVPTFPNAIYHISKKNWDAGIKPNPRDKASYLKENYLTLLDAGVLNLINDTKEIKPVLTS